MFFAVTASRLAGSYRIPSQNRFSSGISSTLVRLARGRSVDIDDIDDTVTQDGPREYHVPVLLNECCEYLVIKENGIYVDCTLGGGGHTREILRRGGRVIGLDQDPDAIAKTSADLISYIESGHLEIIQTNFRYIERAIKSSKFADGMNVDGVLMDLGISSHQIDEPSRGFAFGADGPLDMRMGQGKSILTANCQSISPLSDFFHILYTCSDIYLFFCSSTSCHLFLLESFKSNIFILKMGRELFLNHLY